ncbi:hypothetical protein [Streptomyces sp. NPDC048496]|uniref:hypothetical protein n=1 Tax=Streptomyces sp. NPDC048496 TaxID=3365558 RepID=UPI00372258AD
MSRRSQGHEPHRDWTRLDTTKAPTLTEAASSLVDDVTTYMRGPGWNTDSFSGSIRTLRIVTGHLGTDVLIRETDIRALASMRPFKRLRPGSRRPARGPDLRRSSP